MKQYILGVTACISAILLFAFTAPKGTIYCDNPNSLLVWFTVSGTVYVEGCEVDRLLVDPIPSIVGSISTANLLNPTLITCPPGDELLCAVGYAIIASNFEQIPTDQPNAGKFRPKEGVQPLCCLKTVDYL